MRLERQKHLSSLDQGSRLVVANVSWPQTHLVKNYRDTIPPENPNTQFQTHNFPSPIQEVTWSRAT